MSNPPTIDEGQRVFAAYWRRLVETIPVLVALWIINAAFGIESFWAELLLTPVVLVYVERTKGFDGRLSGLLKLRPVHDLPKFIFPTIGFLLVPFLLLSSAYGIANLYEEHDLPISILTIFALAICTATATFIANGKIGAEVCFRIIGIDDADKWGRSKFFAYWIAAVGLAYLVVRHIHG